ncbi:hypothetical protein RND81_02G221200 [Saponaria officinalis]|uniref:Protein PHYTOCHROME KINASE SUBSTRATE 1-like n=1 Tax=Saponaria officinalis TaxID=3572 RepID=A0AAW1MSF1_SAPOF
MASLSSKNIFIPPSWPSKDTNPTLRDASFSSYLDKTEETYIHTLVTTSQKPRPKKVDDGEIDIFGADKYFNGVVDKKSHTTTVKSRNDKGTNLNLQPRTPSIHSESSSNSQSALLRRVRRNHSNSISSHQGKKSLFMSGYCCRKKSVDIESQDQYINHGKISKENTNEGQITRTIKTNLDTAEITRLNKLRIDTVPIPVITVKKIEIDNDEEEKNRRKKSLEVFGSDEGSKRFSLEKRLNMLSWDAIPRSVEEINTSARESDASSDLFEIECLSTTTNPIRYAPSEASVDWSVVTASAADFTIVSELNNQTSAEVAQKTKKGVQKTKGGGILAGCKSQKAVRVAEGVDRSLVKTKSGEIQRMHRFSDEYSPVTRFKSEAKLPGHGLRQSNKNNFSSDILYI